MHLTVASHLCKRAKVTRERELRNCDTQFEITFSYDEQFS